MSGYRVGVLGATGAVGSTVLEVLAERSFPVSELVPLASERFYRRLALVLLVGVAIGALIL